KQNVTAKDRCEYDNETNDDQHGNPWDDRSGCASAREQIGRRWSRGMLTRQRQRFRGSSGLRQALPCAILASPGRRPTDGAHEVSGGIVGSRHKMTTAVR